jgi:DNA end-binding protein Ku
LDGVLLLETMHYADELRDSAELAPPKASVGQKELDMAETLVKSMTSRWDSEKYHDEYRESLMKIIEQKVKAGAKHMPVPKRARQPSEKKIIDLAELLQQSLEKSAAKKPRRQPATHRKAA